jgi:hypothetical protein
MILEEEFRPDDAIQDSKWRWHFHGDPDIKVERSWCVQDLIPETGAGLISGQWGTYKTFIGLELAASTMSGTDFINFPVRRKGAVLFFACEGQGELPLRLAAAIEAKGIEGKAPFAWMSDCPRLLDANAAQTMKAIIDAAAERMMADFGLPVVLVLIDTVGTAAGYERTGDENDPVVGKKIIATLATVARDCGVFVLGIDHFGKSVETGTRGASSKEADADLVLALLGEKSIAGSVTNPRLAIRKRRSGSNGDEYMFRPKVVDMGQDESGNPMTTLTIEWLTSQEHVGKAAPDPWTKSLRLLKQTLMGTLADAGTDQVPYANGPTVRAIDIETVRAEFYKSYPASGDDKAAARRQAFNRALKAAQQQQLIGVRDIGSATYVWLATHGVIA